MSSMMNMTEFKHNWGLLAACFVGIMLSVGTLAIAYTIGVFIEPLRAEFGWSRAQILGASGVVSVAVGVLSMGIGWLTDRFSIRRLIICSQILFALSFFLMAVGINGLVSFYLLYLLMSITGMATIAVPFAKIITSEFVASRGLALGLVMAGTGVCGFLVPPYAAYVVEQFGWRAGYAAIGLLPLLLAAPLSFFFLRDPKLESAETEKDDGAQSDTGYQISLPLALKGYRFWVLFAVFTIGSCVMTALITNLIPILGDRGYKPTVAATIAGSFGLTVILGRVVVGALIDHVWAPGVGSAIFIAAAVSISLLGFLDLGTTGLILLILLAGFAAGAEVDLMGYLTARYFGLKHFGKIYAGLYIGFALSPGIAAPLFGASRDTYGSYGPGLLITGGLLGLAAILLLTLGRYPDND